MFLPSCPCPPSWRLQVRSQRRTVLGVGLRESAMAVAMFTALSVAATGRADDTADIRSRAATYQTAFNRHDARAVAEHWSEDAVYELESGERVQGRQAIRGVFEKLFAAEPQLQLRVVIGSIRVVTPDAAVEEGRAQVLGAQGEPIETKYTALNIKRNGVWYIDNIRELDVPRTSVRETLSRQEKLQELAWLIGEWTSSDADAVLHSKCEWTKNKTFINRSFTLRTKDGLETSGTQIIGWDPSTREFRSWSFDSEGGVSEGIWSQRGNHWSCKSSGVLPDGRKGSTEHILTYVDDNTVTWQAVGREVDGHILPNLSQIKIVRVPAN